MVPDDAVRTDASELYSKRLDPIARGVLATTDPWDAYRIASKAPSELVADLGWLPGGGAVYRARAELADLYETGKTPIPEAFTALRQAAADWLNRTGLPDAEHVERWVGNSNDAVRARVSIDGDFWRLGC